MARALPYHDTSLRPARTATAKERQAWRAVALGTVQCGENVSWTGRNVTHVGVVVYRGKRRWVARNTQDADWLSLEARQECVAAPKSRHRHKRWGPIIVKATDGRWYCPVESRIVRLDPLDVRAALIRTHAWARPVFTKPPPIPAPRRSSTPAHRWDWDDGPNEEPPDRFDPDALRLLDKLFDG